MTTEHVSVPRDEIEALIKQWKQECMAFADMPAGIPVPKRLYLWNRVADLEDILSRATPSDEDDGEGGNCEVCGSPVRYGSRHHRCGDAMLRAEKRGRESVQTSAPRVVTAELSNTIAGDIAEHLRNKGWSSGGDYQDDFLPDVEIATRAALDSFAASLPAARVPDGWKLVPVEPTEEMIMAASNAAHDVPTHKRWMPAAWHAALAAWHAALAAAPQAGQNDEIAR